MFTFCEFVEQMSSIADAFRRLFQSFEDLFREVAKRSKRPGRPTRGTAPRGSTRDFPGGGWFRTHEAARRRSGVQVAADDTAIFIFPKGSG